jgi:hypothetical protein
MERIGCAGTGNPPGACALSDDPPGNPSVAAPWGNPQPLGIAFFKIIALSIRKLWESGFLVREAASVDPAREVRGANDFDLAIAAGFL